MQHVIITIARQHGSGGRLIGECLAKKMGIAYYDKELISLTAKKTGFALDFVKEVEEKQTSSFLYSIYAAAVVPSVYEQARNAQFSVIRELASKGSCVIVGRAADCILKNLPYCVHVFVHAPLEERIRRATVHPPAPALRQAGADADGPAGLRHVRSCGGEEAGGADSPVSGAAGCLAGGADGVGAPEPRHGQQRILHVSSRQ